ncbi:arylsulfotransferase family protein [Aquimarina sp. 2201CG14-23]|uniref:arylsulfotransferase family protein n=1 Tax=Aquimarina mycalae TaxID=3040073 RepID=UPI002477D499|nr:arylsulfotransferase family protein [Aquimarina sp. 2201CG14-23]MDH7444778.1 arylsulfotransferase family protein [Aquimarina sp. 2201CG14-23]
MKKISLFHIVVCFILLFQTACSSDDNSIGSSTDPGDGNSDDNQNPPLETAGTIDTYIPTLTDDSYLLVNDAASDRVYLMNKEKAEIIHEWTLSGKLGNDAELLDDGTLLTLLEADDPQFSFGGFGGLVKIINPDNSTKWEYPYATEEHLSHHDVEMLPNGNILFLAWIKKTSEEAEQAGYSVSNILYPEALIEVNPTTDEIVWEWHAWDHLIQEHDSTKDNFGVVSDNPQLININYNSIDNGDIMHANGIDYDEENDIIYISVNFYSEVWVIDHSTTTEQASSHIGGQHNKGGDLLYRFGNPTAYNNTQGTRLFHNNHFPNLLEGNEIGKDNVLIFMNGNNNSQSIVYEFKIPNPLVLNPNANNEPETVWSFQDPDLYSGKVSGAIRLPNGNTLITEGDNGYWEVTNNGELAWKFSGDGFYWRGYSYPKNSTAISGLDLP